MANSKSKAPPSRRDTVEVDLAWLEKEKEKDKEPGRRKKPPRLPGAARTIPPMPVRASVPPSRRKPIPREDPES
jgi:hypothetical protein